MYVKITEGKVESYSIGQLRSDNKSISFPKDIPVETLASFDVYPVVKTPLPKVNTDTQHLLGSIQFIDGAWTQTWDVVDLPKELASDNIRSKRDSLLAETDWTQVNDAPVDQAAWATYRQALRDITAQAGFPSNVTWPNKPE